MHSKTVAMHVHVHVNVMYMCIQHAASIITPARICIVHFHISSVIS